MMKTFILVIGLAIANFSFGQTDVISTIADEACKTGEAQWKKGMTEDDRMTSFGLSILTAAAPYSQELKDQYKIKLPKKAGKLGELVAIQMIAKCPAYTLYMAGTTTEADYITSREERGLEVK